MIKYLVRPEDSAVFEIDADGFFSLKPFDNKYPPSYIAKFSYMQLKNLGFKSATKEDFPRLTEENEKYWEKIAQRCKLHID